MKAIYAALWLISAVVVGGAEIERERFSLALPDGWAESREVMSIAVLDDDREARGKTFPKFIAATKDCSPKITAMSQSALQITSFPGISTVYRESVIRSVGGREGFGSELCCRHPYQVVSVVRVFSFESEGHVCTLLISASDQKEEQAAARISRHATDIDAIAKSIKIRSADEDRNRKKG